MAFFSDLWNGIKGVGSSLLDVCGIIVNKLVDGVFWLVNKVFDAVDAIIDLFDWILKKIGNIFSPSDQEGTVIVLPTTPPEVNKLIKDLGDKGVITAPTIVKLNQRKAALQVIQNEKGEIKQMVVAGSEKGFSGDIETAMEQGILYKIPVEL